MATLFLLIIYLAFISLGLPDSLLGVTWPLMRLDFNASLGAAGFISMIISGGTIVSSLLSGTLLHKFGTGKMTFVSVLMTAGALLGFSLAPSFIWLLFLAIPLGLGAGTVDAGLNAYVAAHYKSHHMSWLHCFWGVGAMTGPIIMAQNIGHQSSWRNGYLIVSMVQFALVILLFFALPLWDKVSKLTKSTAPAETEPFYNGTLPKKADHPLKIKGLKIALISFLFYCGAEATMGLWGSSFLINVKGLDVVTAAKWVSMFYAGITVGRLITGFITMKVSNKVLIRSGEIVLLIGALLLLLPLPNTFSLVGFILVGLGCAPIFPCMLHETPERFGKENSQMVMGFQMAVAYTGGTFLPPIFGWIASSTTIAIFPFFILVYVIAMLLSSEKVNLNMKNRHKEKAVY
ncbi:MAG: MFS transporter [Firmicutes bacterium HGW-Firmicutes-7]|nr:MAG: MFS transporter [Firmicutes bacterium HGW-Firmicutes-7]